MHLLVPVPPDLADALAVWGTDHEDLEATGDRDDSDDVVPVSMIRQLEIW